MHTTLTAIKSSLFQIPSVVLIFMMIGCTGNPAIEKSKLIAAKGDTVAAFDILFNAYQKATANSDKKTLRAEMDQLSFGITQVRLSKATDLIATEANMATYQEAIKYLKASLKYDHNGQLKQLLSNYESELSTYADEQTGMLSNFAIALQESRWAESYKLLEQVKKNNPTFSEYENKVNEFHQKRNLYYEQEMQRLIGQQKWGKASNFLNNIKENIPLPKDSWIENFETKFKKNMGGSVLKRAEYLVSRHKYYEAHNLLSGIEIKGKKRLMFKIGRKGVQYYIDQAKSFMEENLDNPEVASGKAYIFAYKAIQLDKYNQEAFALHRDLQDQIIKKIKTYIAISTFGSPNNAPGFGLRFSDSLIAYLTKNLPFSIEIFEKSKVDNIMQESGQSLESLSKDFNLQMHIMGNISTLSVERHRDNGKKTVFVTIGEKQVPNPIYDEYFRSYGKDQKDWPRIVPATITNKENQSISYNMGIEKINALMTASVRLFDTKLGAITKAEIYKTDISEQDDFNDAVEIANIEYNPLDLPSDNTVKEQMIENLIKKIGKVVLASFKDLEQGFWVKADENIKRRENDKALQFLAEGMIFSMKNNLPEENEWYTKIKRAALIELTD